VATVSAAWPLLLTALAALLFPPKVACAVIPTPLLPVMNAAFVFVLLLPMKPTTCPALSMPVARRHEVAEGGVTQRAIDEGVGAGLGEPVQSLSGDDARRHLD